jgi:hypothetical protein
MENNFKSNLVSIFTSAAIILISFFATEGWVRLLFAKKDEDQDSINAKSFLLFVFLFIFSFFYIVFTYHAVGYANVDIFYDIWIFGVIFYHFVGFTIFLFKK